MKTKSMKQKLAEFRILLTKLLNDVEIGKIKPKKLNYGGKPYVKFKVGKVFLIVFNDCGVWDYIEEAQKGSLVLRLPFSRKQSLERGKKWGLLNYGEYDVDFPGGDKGLCA